MTNLVATENPAPQEPRRRRGRPAGSKSRVLGQVTLGTHHFSFLRSYFQGLDTRDAWNRYMAFSEANSDLRHVEHRRTELLAAVLRAGHQLDLTLQPQMKITGLLALLSKAPIGPKAVPIPSMSDFAESQGIDAGDWSEAELLQMYKEHYGLDRPVETDEPAASDSISDQVRALNHVATILARQPALSDRVELWIHPKVAQRLKTIGASDIGKLIDAVNVYGFYWYQQIKGLGEIRATAIVRWLQTLEVPLGKPLRTSALTPPVPALPSSGSELVTGPIFGIVPLDQLAVPSELQGATGEFRSHMANTLGAKDDQQAIQAWLSKHREHPHTYRSYTKEIERFYLWCIHELKKPLSSVNGNDCQAYREFLGNLPSSWIQVPGSRRTNDDRWRPFRKKLAPSSVKQAVIIVQAMFTDLKESGYLVANPMRSVSKGFDLPESTIDIKRSLTDAEWEFVMSVLMDLPEGAVKRRLHAILELLTSTGLRLIETAKACWKDLALVDVDGEDYKAWILTVIGKRKKKREVPVPDDVVDLLKVHRNDVLATRVTDSGGALPLIGVVDKATKRFGKLAAERPSPALSSSAIYAQLRTFFKRCAAICPAGIDSNHLERASTHWLRHTFGRQAAVAGVPGNVLQQTLGHTSIATTGIYLSSERSRMVTELRKVRQRKPNAT